eukprot:3755050-Alexandrium_andersonii.AAC.1
MSALRAAIVRVLALKAASARSTGVALCAVTKKCVDPLVHVLVARIVAMRRACVLEPTTVECLREGVIDWCALQRAGEERDENIE